MKKPLLWPEWKQPPIPKPCRDSQHRATLFLIEQAWGYRPDLKKIPKEPTDSMPVPMDVDEMYLADMETYPTQHVLAIARPYAESLEAQDRGRFVARLMNKSKSAKLKKRPDWSSESVDQVERYLVMGWCDRITVDGEKWPPLCCLSWAALAKFLTLCKCKPPLWSASDRYKFIPDAKRLQKICERLGLVPIPKGKFKHVEKSFGQFRFA